MVKVLTAEQMRRAEQASARLGIATETLMENAGRAVAGVIRQRLGDPARHDILVLTGPGNNGGDGLVAARYLREWGFRVSLYLTAPRPEDDPNLKLAAGRGVPIQAAADDSGLARLDERLGAADTVLDAIFGTGRIRPITGVIQRALTRLNEARGKRADLAIFALDLPSGLDADSGAVDPVCPEADETITLGFPKPGLFQFPGMTHVGRLTTVDIGIPPRLAADVNLEMVDDGWARSQLPRRPLVAHKGSFGKVLAVVGSINYTGAAYLACSGAVRVGAGLVTLATATSLGLVLATKLTEVTQLPLPESAPHVVSATAARLLRRELPNYDALLIGCGLGQSHPAAALFRTLLFTERPGPARLVIDADGLGMLARVPAWWQLLPGDAVLTPHPGEMARLLGTSAASVLTNRLELARTNAATWGKTIVLKGPYTIIAAPDGRTRLSPFANPGLASAGTGDVLAGAVAGLLAQEMSLFDAATLGVYLHGKAGESVRAELGDTGMAASDLLPALPRVIRDLKETRG